MKMKNSSSGEKLVFLAGILLLTIGVICNEWTLLHLYSPDDELSLPNRAIIYSFNLLCVIAATLLIKFRRSINSFIQLRKNEFILFFITSILLFTILEVSIRIYYAFNKSANPPRHELSAEYPGWQTIPNSTYHNIIEGCGEIIHSYQDHGFRVFGSLNTRKTKIFVIGDSYTEAYTVNDGEAFYDVIKKENENIEIFAYGCSGYGSLQEVLIVNKFLDLINPDIILLQFHSNDIADNDYELYSFLYPSNEGIILPYYVNGEVKWMERKKGYGWMLAHSYLLRFISVRVGILRYISALKGPGNKKNPLLGRALKTTEDILCLMTNREDAIPVISFSVDHPEWLGNGFFEMCEKCGIKHLEGIGQAIEAAKETGSKVDCLPGDDHWNHRAHRIAGEVILRYLIEEGFIEAKHPKAQ